MPRPSIIRRSRGSVRALDQSRIILVSLSWVISLVRLNNKQPRILLVVAPSTRIENQCQAVSLKLTDPAPDFYLGLIAEVKGPRAQVVFKNSSVPRPAKSRHKANHAIARHEIGDRLTIPK
jgi:hypothetical protein